MRQAVQLLSPTAMTTSDSTIFTTSALGVTIIRKFVIANSDNVARTFSIGFGGTSVTASNNIASNISVPANTTTVMDGPFTVPASTAVHANGSATTLTISASGELSVAGG